MWFFDILPWWAWLISSIGLVGTIILIFAAPAVAITIFRGLLTLFVRILQTRIGLAAVVGLACLVGGYFGGAIYLEQKCEARIEDLRAKAEVARLARDAEITKKLEDKYAPIVAALQKDADDRQTQVTDLERKILDDKSRGACQLGTDALRLRNKRR